MTKYEKVMVRDAPLALVDIWWQGHALEIPKFFGIKWVDPIFVFRGAAVESWRPVKFFQEEAPVTFAKWLTESTKNKNFLLKSFFLYRQAVKGLDRLAERRKVQNLAILIAAIREVREIIRQGLVGLIPAFWLWSWQEKFLSSAGKSLFEKEILDKALSIRKGDTFFDDGIDLVYKYLYQVAKIKGWPKEAMKFFLFSELARAIKKTKAIDLGKVSERKNGYIFIKGKIYPLAGLHRLLRKHQIIFQEDRIVKSKIVKGIGASTGRRRGVVRVVLNREQMSKVKKGDILVAPMTTPSYLPAMRRAAAFVTDEGGLTSHAAILAREMNKPCIVGTRIATQVLRDGDRVEVDAKRGLITRLRKR